MSSSTANMPRPPAKQGLPGGAFTPTLVVLGVIVFALIIVAEFWTEMAWFSQIGASRVFWTQYGAAISLGVVGALLAAIVFALNLRVALGKARSSDDVVVSTNPLAKNVQWLRRHSVITYGLIPLVIGALFGAGLAGSWRTFLLWFNGTSFGTKDPEYGLDVSFFVFSLPALQIVLSFLSTLLVISLGASIVGYWANGAFVFRGNKPHLKGKAQLHLGILLAAGAFLFAGNYWLGRYNLLLGNKQRFSGATYTDINASQPGLTILAIASALVALMFLYAGIVKRWKPAVVGIASVFAVALVVNAAYPALLQRFKVDPNAAELESEFIQRNINATLDAYGLANVEKQQYEARTTAEAGQLRQDSQTTAQIRLLDPNIVDPSFNQLQQNRQYYSFKEPLTVDRYTINGELRDTVIAVRELNLDGLDNERRSWVNDHTVFTHGFGVAAAYGNTVTSKGDPAFWEAGIPSTGELGKFEPRVYFGQQSPEYSIVGAPEKAKPWELDYPNDAAPNGQVNTTYKGDGGPSIGNLWSKLMFAIKYRSTELFFSDRVTSHSQILFDRDPHKRVAKVAPYLTLDSKAVPAVVDMDSNPDTPSELVWIIDGYTTTNNYPYSARETLNEATADSNNRAGARIAGGTNEINYIRNSVKAVVNAYDGKVTLYQWDDKDPILKAWDGIFPGQITPLKKMPGDLIAHVRYPEDLFKVQRTLLARYHVEDALSFYSGGDFWQIPREPTAKSETEVGAPAQPPYYLTMKMPGQDEASFSLYSAYIPGGNTKRNVMTGFLAADSNAGNETGKIAPGYGKLRLLELPRDLTVPGPGQAQNTMFANPKVSTDLNLLRQGGTKVLEGNLLSLPVGGGLLYVQPVYVQASKGTQYPTLQYVLTLFGDSVGFAPTLQESLDMVFGGDAGVNAGDANIVGNKEAPVDGNQVKVPAKPDGKKDAKPDPAEKPAPAGPSAPDAGKPATPSTPAADLAAALNDAKDAIKSADSAMKSGDWAAYGDAQKKLNAAITRAAEAQQKVDAK
ncbi:UPF0182 family membrane protein [Arcanobacterium haemolyticum]